MLADDAFDERLRDAKLAALAEFAAGAGHEINNPVATIVGRAQLLLKSETDLERRRSLATIAGQALRIRDMIGDLMLFARPPEPRPVWCDLAEIVRETASPFAERAAEVGCRLEFSIAPVTAFIDPEQLAVAIAALLENACNAVAAGGRVSVAVTEREGVPVLSVSDDGASFTEIEREHAFDPFFSGRQAGRGLGFGLPKCWRIVTAAGGRIELLADAGATTFRIALPRPDAPA